MGTLKTVSRDEDNILDQIYVKQIFSDFNYDLKFIGFKILRMIEENAYLKQYRSQQERAHKIGF